MKKFILLAIGAFTVLSVKAEDIIAFGLEIEVIEDRHMSWIDVASGGMGYVISWVTIGQTGGNNTGNTGGGGQTPNCQTPLSSAITVDAFTMHGLDPDFVNGPTLGIWGNPFTFEFTIAKKDGSWNLMTNQTRVVWSSVGDSGETHTQTISSLTILHQDANAISYKCPISTPIGLGSGMFIVTAEATYTCGSSFFENIYGGASCLMINEQDKGLRLSSSPNPNPSAVATNGVEIDFVKCDTVLADIEFSRNHSVSSTVSGNLTANITKFIPAIGFTIGWSDTTSFQSGSKTTYKNINFQGYLEIKKKSQTAYLEEYRYNWNGTQGPVVAHGQAVSKTMTYAFIQGTNYCN